MTKPNYEQINLIRTKNVYANVVIRDIVIKIHCYKIIIQKIKQNHKELLCRHIFYFLVIQHLYFVLSHVFNIDHIILVLT